VFLLAGGPGQSAIELAGFGQAVFGRLNRRRDLVFVDQRGTGRSAPLHCPELESASEVVDNEAMLKMTEACMQKLQTLPYGDLRYFSTSIAVQDLEAVRKELGYSAINLVGASYGTRAGLEYLRQFPTSVRRLVLDGIAPPEMQLVSADAQLALDGVFADCAKDLLCNKSYPDLAARWKKLLATLPQKIEIKHPRLIKQLSMPMTRDSLIGMVHKTLYSPATTAALPYAITQAELGHFDPLVALSGALSLVGPGAIAYGMHFSVWCGEAYARPTTLVPKDDFELMSSSLYNKVCEKWPHASIPPEFFDIPVSVAPVLLLSGGIDPVTPTRHGAAVAKALGAKAKHIVIENAGHGLLAHGCIRDVLYRYVNAKDDAEAIKLDTACVRQIPRPLAWQAPVHISAGSQLNSGAKP
jgi:pimeloyl-ACP methyl ester carboxylesterase